MPAPLKPQKSEYKSIENDDIVSPIGVASLDTVTEIYLKAREVDHYSPRTIRLWRRYIRRFRGWCDERGVVHAQEVTKQLLDRYRRYLYYYRKKDGKPLSIGSQHQHLTMLRGMFRWLVQHDYLPSNPASELQLPKLPHRLPKVVLTPEEIEKIMKQPKTITLEGIRDRTMLEVLYATGVRRMELARLSIYDIDVNRKTLMVRQGKGNSDRLVPISDRALEWVMKYTDQVRPKLMTSLKTMVGKFKDPELPHGIDLDEVLFLTKYGTPFSVASIGHVVKGYVESANIPGKTGGCHLFRHALATALLENGAEIRYVQAILGHRKLETTQIYTYVTIDRLQNVYRNAHPFVKDAELGF